MTIQQILSLGFSHDEYFHVLNSFKNIFKSLRDLDRPECIALSKLR